MKPTLLLPPLAALIIAGTWLGLQRQSIATLQLESAALGERIAAARTASPPAADPSFAARQRTNSLRSGSKVDWKKVAAAQIAMRSGQGASDMRAMVELQKTLRDLSPEELLAGLDEIAALDLSNDARRELESTLIGILAHKDPELVLERFADRIGGPNGTISWELASAFQSWSGQDATAATAWMDRQLAAGTFDSKSLDGRNDTRLRFEAGLIQNLAESDPAAAARRLAALPEDQRAGVFRQGMFLRIKPGNGKAIADLIRTQLPENSRVHSLAEASRSLVDQGGFERVGDFLGEIDASAAERSAIVGQALLRQLDERNETPPEIEETRAWILAQAPADAERLTGVTLARMVGQRDFSEMAAEALKFQQSSGSDEALIAFLTHAPDYSRSEILELAEKISDPVKRNEVTSRFINNPNRMERPSALESR
jgi:hypothetical protein